MCGKGRISWAIWGWRRARCWSRAPPPRRSPRRRTPPAPSTSRPPPSRPPRHADAGQAKAKRRRRPRPPSVDVVVTNKRTVALTALLASASGSPDSKKIAGPLAAGKKIGRPSRRRQGLPFRPARPLRRRLVDRRDGVDLCKDKTINLVD